MPGASWRSALELHTASSAPTGLWCRQRASSPWRPSSCSETLATHIRGGLRAPGGRWHLACSVQTNTACQYVQAACTLLAACSEGPGRAIVSSSMTWMQWLMAVKSDSDSGCQGEEHPGPTWRWALRMQRAAEAGWLHLPRATLSPRHLHCLGGARLCSGSLRALHCADKHRVYLVPPVLWPTTTRSQISSSKTTHFDHETSKHRKQSICTSCRKLCRGDLQSITRFFL